MTIERLKLYHYPATRSARVKWLLHEVVGDAFEVEPQLARRLERAPYVCGEAFTAADCVVGHTVTWARGYGLCRDEIFRRYLSTLSKRPAFAQAFADAREFSPAVPQDNGIVARFTG